MLRIHELTGEACEATVSVAWPFDEITETSLIEDEIESTVDPCEKRFFFFLSGPTKYEPFHFRIDNHRHSTTNTEDVIDRI